MSIAEIQHLQRRNSGDESCVSDVM